MAKTKQAAPRGPEELAALIADMREDECLARLSELLAQGEPAQALLEGCMEGMRRVGQRFQEGRYFMAALVMAGEIMARATEILRPHLGSGGARAPARGTVLLATVKGDIHDLGKDLVALLLRCNGFEVVDLGVDVPAEGIVSQARALAPDLVGLSCTLTSALESLRSTVASLRANLPAGPTVIIGGCCVDEHVRQYAGADLWGADAVQGVELCRVAVERRSSRQGKSWTPSS